MGSLQDLREQIFLANLELNRRGLVIYTFGNVSGVDRDQGIMAIKPSGVPYSELSPEKIVLVDLTGQVVDSVLRPSSDTRTHLALYIAFKNVGGVVHTHSSHATAWAQACRSIPCYGTTHADYVHGPVPCTAVMSDAQIAGDYEEETGTQIIEAFRDLSYTETEMVLVARHGPFTWGHTPQKAIENSVILEELAKTAYLTEAVAPGLSPLKQPLMDKHFQRKHGRNAYYGQEHT